MIGLIGVLLLLARAYPGSGADLVDWKPTRSHEVEAQLEIDDVQQMLEAQNEKRRRRGAPELTEDERAGWRRGRARPPPRARPLESGLSARGAGADRRLRLSRPGARGALAGRGWVVRGTTRTEGAAAIEAAGIEPAIADPDRTGTVLDGDVEGVALICWARRTGIVKRSRRSTDRGSSACSSGSWTLRCGLRLRGGRDGPAGLAGRRGGGGPGCGPQVADPGEIAAADPSDPRPGPRRWPPRRTGSLAGVAAASLSAEGSPATRRATGLRFAPGSRRGCGRSRPRSGAPRPCRSGSGSGRRGGPGGASRSPRAALRARR